MIIWASVSEEVDARISEQIKVGVFPVRLKPEDWTSGKINWLLDLVAPLPQHATAVIANFKQAVKGGELLINPLVSPMLDGETLRRIGVATGLVTAPESGAEKI
jgi:cytolysin-activating lysine-acyltransferase